MKNKIICFLFIFLFSVVMLFVSLVPVSFGYNATENVMLTTGSSLQDAFQVDILTAFNDNNINFNDWSLSYYYSYMVGSTYEFYISSGPIQVGSNSVIKTIGNNTLWFSYSNNTWTYNSFYGPSATIGSYNFNTFYFLNEPFNLGLNANNFSVDSSYFQVDISLEPEEPEEDTGLLQGIRDFFVGLFIPNQTQFEEIQANFSQNILSKFNIISLSRGNTSYNNNDIYEYTFANQLPVFEIYGYKFKGQMLYDFMHTPLSFGYLEKWKDNYTQWVTPVQTGGITLFDIFNLIFGISITALNIVLYNKFFNKGG